MPRLQTDIYIYILCIDIFAEIFAGAILLKLGATGEESYLHGSAQEGRIPFDVRVALYSKFMSSKRLISFDCPVSVNVKALQK